MIVATKKLDNSKKFIMFLTIFRFIINNLSFVYMNKIYNLVKTFFLNNKYLF